MITRGKRLCLGFKSRSIIQIFNRFLMKNSAQSKEDATKTCVNCSCLLDEFGHPIQSNEENHSRPNIATDAIVIKKVESSIKILLVVRKYDPFKGKFALPGGFLDYNEDPQQGCLRELMEETNITGYSSSLFTVKSDPTRDPRKHILSLIYAVNVSEDSIPEGKDDALSAHFYDLDEILSNGPEEFAFDHHSIISEYKSSKL